MILCLFNITVIGPPERRCLQTWKWRGQPLTAIPREFGRQLLICCVRGRAVGLVKGRLLLGTQSRPSVPPFWWNALQKAPSDSCANLSFNHMLPLSTCQSSFSVCLLAESNYLWPATYFPVGLRQRYTNNQRNSVYLPEFRANQILKWLNVEPQFTNTYLYIEETTEITFGCLSGSPDGCLPSLLPFSSTS